MKIQLIAIPMVAALSMVGCKQQATVQEEEQPVVVTAEPTDVEEPTAEVELVPVLRKAQPAAAKPATRPAAKPAAPVKKSTQAETIYVETDGAQGRVWGHVTMNGDRGTGTIHDWDENTLTVNVTRHGNELFAIDQNSRLYVFKLKQ